MFLRRVSGTVRTMRWVVCFTATNSSEVCRAGMSSDLSFTWLWKRFLLDIVVALYNERRAWSVRHFSNVGGFKCWSRTWMIPLLAKSESLLRTYRCLSWRCRLQWLAFEGVALFWAIKSEEVATARTTWYSKISRIWSSVNTDTAIPS